MAMKIMRKYSKPLMAVFGVLLMVTFLIGYSVQSGVSSAAAGYTLGTLGKTSITSGMLTGVSVDIRILRSLETASPQLEEGLLWLDTSQEGHGALQFYLLLHEATREGFTASDQQVQYLLQDKSLHKAAGELIAGGSYVSDNIVQALRDYQSIQNLAFFAADAAQPSEPQLLHFMSRRLSKVQVQYVCLQARAAAARMPAPSAALVSQLYQTYRTVVAWSPDAGNLPPRLNGHRYPFGYRYPPRVQVQYIKLDRDALRARMKPTLADVQAAYRYYQSNLDQFLLPPPASAASQPANAKPAYQSFDQVKQQLIKRQLDKQIDVIFRHITDLILHQTAKPWGSAGQSGYAPKLSRAKWVSYRKMAQLAAAQFGYQPKVVTLNQKLNAAQLAALAGIGQARASEAGLDSQAGFANLALRVHKLEPKATGIAMLLHLQVGREGPLLTDADGNEYIYRVTAASAAHNPASLAKVKEQVIRDARLLEAFKADVKQGQDLVAVAGAKGLAVAAAQDGLKLYTPNRFSEFTQGYNYYGQPVIQPTVVSTLAHPVPHFTEQAVRLAVQVQAAGYHGDVLPVKPQAPKAAGHGPGKTAVARLPAAVAYTGMQHPATMLLDEPRLNVYVMQLIGSWPVPQAQLMDSENRGSDYDRVWFSSLQGFLGNFLSLKSVSQRVGFVPASQGG